MTPANVLPIEEGDVVFDMCAAPGGKSTELAAKLNKTGLLVTNDISNSRAKALLKNVEVFGVLSTCIERRRVFRKRKQEVQTVELYRFNGLYAILHVFPRLCSRKWSK